MTITTSFMTFKQQLLLVMMFVCALQVTITSASLFKLNSPRPSDDAKIDKFRKFATKKRSILSISRNYDHDDIVSLEQCDSLIIRLETSLHYISQTRVSMIEYIKVILPETTKSDYEKNEIIVQHNAAQKQLAQPSSVLAQYLAAYLHAKPATVEGVKTFVILDRKRTNEERRKLAKYIVPLGMYMFKYDKAIDYITRQYQKECLNYDGIVQQNKWYYITSWKNILNRINGEATQDWTVWETFMATACPSPDPEEVQSDDLQANNLQPLDLVDFDEKISVPKRVVPFVPYLPMIKDCSKNSDLINELVERFNRYKKMSPTDRKAHDGDIWIGYQKKLIVQQTIIRVMREKLGKTSEVEQSDEESDDDDEQISKRPWNRRAANWTAKYKLKAFGVALAVGIPSIGSYLWLSGGALNLSKPLPNITLPPSLGVTDHRILSIEPVWLIVGVMIIVAIVLVGTVLCLICHRRNRLRKPSSDNDESDKTSKTAESKAKKERKNPIAKRSIRRSPASSTCPLTGTPTSTKPSSSSPVRLRSSLFTTSAFTPSDILGTIHRPSRTNTHGSSQPVKSPMGKPNSNPSTPASKPSKSPIPKIPTGVRRSLEIKPSPTSPSTGKIIITKPYGDPKGVHKKKK